MPDTFTPNLTLTQPEVGASADTWGAKLNTDFAVLDALFAPSGAGTVLTRDGTGRSLLGAVAQITGGRARARFSVSDDRPLAVDFGRRRHGRRWQQRGARIGSSIATPITA
jgi:hypothetical protein